MTADPATLTFAEIAKWSGTEMRNQMTHPQVRAAVIELLKNRSLAEVQQIEQPPAVPEVPVLSPEEQAAADEATALAAQQAEADRIAVEQLAAAKAAADAEAAKPKKIVLDYQIKDEDGNPIGRPTHLEATNDEEMRLKMIEAHTQATRAFHRLKKQKLTFAKEPEAPKPDMTDKELLDAINDVKT